MNYLTRNLVQVYKFTLGIPHKSCKLGAGTEVNVTDSRMKYNYIDSPVRGWILSSMLAIVDAPPPPVDPPIVTGELNLYRTLHPYPATHDGYFWPARPDNYPIAPNNGSFDVYSRLYTLPSKTSDGGAIRLTMQQWVAIVAKNDNPYFANWAVRGTDRIMMWQDGYQFPVFHYPLCFGGNLVNVLEFKGNFARIETWPAGKDIPADLPAYLWHRCWSVYKSKENQIRDAPCGEHHVAYPAYMVVLAHSDSAWIHRSGLIR